VIAFAHSEPSTANRRISALLAVLGLAGVAMTGMVADSASAAGPVTTSTHHARAAAQPPALTVPDDAVVDFTGTTLTTVTPPPPVPAVVGSRAGGGAAAAPSGWPSAASLDQAASELGLDPKRFVLEDKGSWGVADWYHDTVYIAPRTPASKLRSVLIHEQAHLDHARTYGGDIDALTHDANRVFGGSGLSGAERAADCIALLHGASWTHYTGCSDLAQQDAARTLAAGRRL
jgi:hypothetical protein